METRPNWPQELPAAITVCDATGIILSMNDKACKSFEEDGGAALIGTNVLDCHPPNARVILEDLLRTGKTNIYTIEKNGQKKLIYQAPWYNEGKYAGLVEMAIVLPERMEHFVRKDR